ncbi:MAG TPA: hypothetical protein VKB39_05970 [Candidatus Baltobacteraceae bacterium]|nr:hypothetical protein [Candidatus Baltobacteraceae bacterium]
MDQSSSGAGAAVFLVIFAIEMIVILAFVAFSIWCYWKIAAKAGYNPALSLLMIVPLANFIILAIFAFGRWPIEEKLAALEGGGVSPPPSTAPGTSVVTT